MNVETDVTIKLELTILQLKALLKLEELAEKINKMYSEDFGNTNETIDMLWNQYAFACNTGLIKKVVQSVKNDLEAINKIL